MRSHSAPPTRHGIVTIRRQRWRVDRVRCHAEVVQLEVSNRRTGATFLSPFDRPQFAARRSRRQRMRPRRALAILAGVLASAVRWRDVRTPATATIAVLPHQLEPALALAAGTRRVLIADEVGLGKTIQAGIAIGECLRRRPEARVLIVAPASLHDQWSAELADRFGIAAARGDRGSLEAESRLGAFGDNPWLRRAIWIASLDFLKQPHVAAGLPLRFWDLVVVDEAHDACGDSARFQAGTALARRARTVLLLTATPHSGDEARFARLLSFGALGDADDRLTILRRTRRQLGSIVARRVRWRRVTPSADERAALDALLAFERRVRRVAGAPNADAVALLLSVFRKRALSTMAALAATVARRLEWLERRDGAEPAWLQPSLQFDDGPTDAWHGEEIDAICGDIGLAPALERTWLRRLRDLAARAARDERRLAHVVRSIERSREPVVIFTEYRDSLYALQRRLGAWRPLAVIHGGLSDAEQRRERDRFLGGDASVLIATDVAGQGLNLQARARWVIALELPWNPARLEQRAGRVDRIGQRRSVHVTWLCAAHPAGDRLERLLRARVDRARSAVGGDALEMSVPADRAIRDHVMSGTALDADGGAGVARSLVEHRFRRPAIVAARRAIDRRGLRARWRSPALPDRVTDARLGGTRPWQALLIFVTEIHDANHDSLETMVSAMAWAADASPRGGTVPDDVVAAARDRVAAAARLRARRLARQLARTLERRRDRERTLTAAAIRDLGSRRSQPGLFDRCEAQRVEMLDERVADLEHDNAAEREAIDRSRLLEASEPRLALVLRA